ncbi:PTS glucose/sucrose transporter subunit IIB [Streptomyces sulphureus]|uniref:PTS glucose/sucrose transporter subunit IIB n=1 Tax=Streptomyces sulphureus TaxID=47758 RepID=UPI00247FA28B|nr:PTS glucose/sucrose transporter subunit IIB [Streptomyces sulphureus]
MGSCRLRPIFWSPWKNCEPTLPHRPRGDAALSALTCHLLAPFGRPLRSREPPSNRHHSPPSSHTPAKVGRTWANVNTPGTAPAFDPAADGTGERRRGQEEQMANKAEKIVAALGGLENIEEVEGCITRLRTEVHDPALVDEAALKAAGAHGVVKMGTAVQVVIGTDADPVANEIEDMR